jgi:gliding motility-associated-like protein
MPSNISVCDDSSNDGISVFDLTVAGLEALGAQDPADFIVTYHLSLSDAEENINNIDTPESYQNSIGSFETIYVRVENIDNSSCYSTAAFSITVYPFESPSFTMVPTCDGAMATVTGLSGGTFTFTTPPTDAAVIDPSTGTVTGGTPGATYTVTYTTNGDCPNTGDVTFTVNPLPLVVAPTPLEVCDDNVPDGFTEIDLTLKNTEITGNTPTSVVSYYLTQADADAGDLTTALPIPYTNIANPQTVYVRVENVDTGCYDTTTLELVVEQAPVANVPAPLEYCDPDSDGFGVFDIAGTENEITGGVAGLNVTYHETFSNAENGVNELGSPYNNIVANAQTIYVRVESETIATDCATIVPLVLIVNPTPQIEDPTPLQVCDDALADGFAQFDLTSKNTEILNGLPEPQYEVSYYELEADAEVPTNAIATPAAYTNTVAFNQTLWVRVDDTANGCYKVTTLDLIVNALPVLVQPTELSLCDVNNPGDEMEAFTLEDANAEILNGQTGITLTYYETQADADSGTNPIASPYINTSNPQTVYVRAENDNTGCVSTVTLTLRVDPVPSPTLNPTPIEVCDGDNDGFASFDLESRTVEIINGELDIQITYHETQEDANNGQDALVSPYDNIVENNQIVYARAENTETGCFTVVELELIVLPSPEIPVDIDDYVICDTDNDGLAQFDLTTKNAEILGTQPPADFTLTYHVTQANADTGANPIINVANYTNVGNPQTIYVRLVSVANGCVSTGQFDIRVELPPVAIQPTPLALCDDDVDDEITVFDLTVKNTEITGGEGSWSVRYYETSADAQADTNVIDPDTAYTNTVNPQTLFVRVTDTETGCTDFVTLTIRVLPNPTPSLDPEDLALCDDTNTGDGQEAFDLTENEAYILNGETGVTPTYHTSEDDAEAGVNAIVDPTAYTNANTDYTAETIYVRVTNDVTGCYTIVQFNITVNPLPEVVAVTDYIICELDNDGAAGFDLATKDAEVLNGQDPSIFGVTYHVSQADADNLDNPLVSPYTSTSNPQPIYVVITNNITGCSISTQVFNLEVQEAAQANADMEPINYVICDNIGDNDGFGQFDLTTQDAEVLDGQDPANYIVSYYASEANAELGVEPLPFTYENVANPQVIYARVDNDTPDGAGADTSICYAVTPLTLQVDLLPIFDLEDTYTLCVDTNGTEVINPPVLDTGLSTADYTFEWSLDATVLPGETGPSLTATQPGVYSVLVTNNATGCQNTDSAVVEASSPPTLVAEVATQAFSENHVIVAEATGDGTYEYSLDGGPWQGSGTFTDVSFGEHVVTARDIEGCGEASVTVFVMDYPKFFTPNGDGYHDTWNIVGIAGQPGARIYIFDRYGKLLKQLDPTGEGWNGTYNGEPMPTSDYWFTVEYSEPSTGQRKEFKAHFTLKR